MKLTESRDGLQRVTIRVEHRLVKEELIGALAYDVSSLEVYEDLPEVMPEAEIMKRIRETLRDNGGDITWGHEIPDEYTEWATAQIDRIIK